MGLTLRQTLVVPVNGYWDGGPKSVFNWSIDRRWDDGTSRVGSWEANYYFTVKTGETDRVTLGNARRHLKMVRGAIKCTFEYIEE